MLNKILKIVGIVAIVLVALAASYYFIFIASKNTKSEVKVNSKEEAVRDRFRLFSDMIDVKLCQEAYDEFITAKSMQYKGFEGFRAHCTHRSEDWDNININNIVFSGDTRADIKYSYDRSIADLDSKEYRDCADVLGFNLCEKTAPKKILPRETVETWILESNKWKRDY